MKYLIIFLAALLLRAGTAQGGEAGPGPAIPWTVDHVCWSVTSYWPFALYADGEKQDFYSMEHDEIIAAIEAGARWEPVRWGGQANDDPTHTGDGTFIDPYTANWSLVAGPISTYWRTFEFPWGVSLVQHDTFGAKAYQDGVFYHDYYRQLVIGVDILSFEPIHYLECEGVIHE